MDGYLGGIGQGLKKNEQTVLEIKSRGGWIAVSLAASDRWNFNLGGSIDDPDDQQLGKGDRAQNAFIFGNTILALNGAIDFALEVSYWKTKYKELGNRQGCRTQFGMLFKF